MKELKVFIEPEYISNVIRMFVIEQDGSIMRNYSMNGGELIATEFPYNQPAPQDLKPLLSLPSFIGEQIFKKITEYSADKGIKTVNENRVEGELKATKLHLEDMQHFAKTMLGQWITKD